MSAVMSTLSMISGGRRGHRKLTSSRKSGQLSDAGEDRSRALHDLNKQQRSASLRSEPQTLFALKQEHGKKKRLERMRDRKEREQRKRKKN